MSFWTTFGIKNYQNSTDHNSDSDAEKIFIFDFTKKTRMKRLLFVLLASAVGTTSAQVDEDSSFIRKIYDEALENGHAYENLRSLCKDIGHRITASAEAKMAIEWGRELLESYDFGNVYLQEIKVPHWERGNKEAGWMIAERPSESSSAISTRSSSTVV